MTRNTNHHDAPPSPREFGGSSLEYLLIAVGIALAVAAAGVAFQDQLSPLFDQIKAYF